MTFDYFVSKGGEKDFAPTCIKALTINCKSDYVCRAS